MYLSLTRLSLMLKTPSPQRRGKATIKEQGEG